jgi:DNA end-binding protein Ku
MPRPIWKGHLSFGLVNIPVTLHSAEARESHLDFDMLDSRDLSRVRYLRVNEKTGKEVPWKSIVKGIKRKDDYIVLEEEDFKRAAAGVTKGLEITEFVNGDSISAVFFERPYYVAPGDGGDKGYALLRDALKKTGRIGIARLVIHTRERLAAIMPEGNGLTLVTMRFGDEVRNAEEVDTPGPGAARLAAKELSLAVQLIEGLAADWNPSKYHNTYTQSLKKVVEQKAKAGGKRLEPIEEEEPEPTPRSDIIELLRQSVKGAAPGRHKRPAKRRVHARSRSGR